MKVLFVFGALFLLCIPCILFCHCQDVKSAWKKFHETFVNFSSVDATKLRIKVLLEIQAMKTQYSEFSKSKKSVDDHTKLWETIFLNAYLNVFDVYLDGVKGVEDAQDTAAILASLAGINRKLTGIHGQLTSHGKQLKSIDDRLKSIEDAVKVKKQEL